MSVEVLLTSAEEDSEEFISWAEGQELSLMHLPLERYTEIDDDQLARDLIDELDSYENIVYGNKRNATFFLEQVKRHNLFDRVRERVNLTLEKRTANFLEEAGIPAICTFGGARPINLVEFMLRLRRTGPTLYPCGTHTKEEVPGFLKELDIPVHELELYDLEGPVPEDLETYRLAVDSQQPDIVIFHSRKAVNRIQAAFPNLDYSGVTVISADTGVSNKLEETGIGITSEADGSWSSIITKLEEQV